jgi:hypothetical protein
MHNSVRQKPSSNETLLRAPQSCVSPCIIAEECFGSVAIALTCSLLEDSSPAACVVFDVFSGVDTVTVGHGSAKFYTVAVERGVCSAKSAQKYHFVLATKCGKAGPEVPCLFAARLLRATCTDLERFLLVQAPAALVGASISKSSSSS